MRTLVLSVVVATTTILAGCQLDEEILEEILDQETFELVSFNGESGSMTLNRPETVNLQVAAMNSAIDIRSDVHAAIFSGQNNTVTVRDGVTIDRLILSGINTMITIEENVIVNEVKFTGTGYTVQIPAGMKFNYTDDGISNQVITN